MMFQTSFQLMHLLMRNLQLPMQDKIAILGKLTDWLTNGVQFLEGNTVGLQLLNDIKAETSTLSKYLLDVVSYIDEGFEEVHKAMTNIECEFDKILDRVKDIGKNQEQMECDIKDLQLAVESIKDETADISKIQEEDRQQVQVIQSTLDNVKIDVDATKQKVESVEIDQKVIAANV
ncbi:uncharacterized protein LOC123544790 isoform X2 [Mercenaria mercenaria]|uniref:uncharacterized protein LOC123544790 isoform X2 n=1 Tax=Mercenaria mercenaria TaxID=6596 RepID=UPI00234E5658|nr:uncharacterized protein LOC123544790 isoform X2 [Mercenaria mercenaria]